MQLSKKNLLPLEPAATARHGHARCIDRSRVAGIATRTGRDQKKPSFFGE
ncbi:MAG: hypothetical protein KGH90_02820 [Xanthomonadaceae bacterium]|nr:hypothetical protein [Xanthomonadaceae bacterium]